MPSRIKNVFRQIVPSGTTSAVVSVPRGTTHIQFVVDRQPFEKRGSDTKLFFIRLFSGREYLGGAEFTDRMVDLEDAEKRAARPGMRMLWSFGRWPIPEGIRQVTIELEAYASFQCTTHVDFFP